MPRPRSQSHRARYSRASARRPDNRTYPPSTSSFLLSYAPLLATKEVLSNAEFTPPFEQAISAATDSGPLPALWQNVTAVATLPPLDRRSPSLSSGPPSRRLAAWLAR